MKAWSRIIAALAVIALVLRWETPVTADTPSPDMVTKTDRAVPLAHEGSLPELATLVSAEMTSWLNSPPLTRASLMGKVVVVDFWTYSCINSLRNIPHVRSWAERYKNDGLVVVGVHTPEFGFERDLGNIQNAVREYQISFPVAVDSDYRVWDAFKNEYWPADYFIDRNGNIRHHHFGEGDYEESERVIQQLLRENGGAATPTAGVRISAPGVEAPPSETIGSPETYVGYHRADSFASPEKMRPDQPASYTAPARPALNQWGFAGAWNVGRESAVDAEPHAKIVFRFHSRDLHIVLGPSASGAPIRFTVKLDGSAPGNDHGVDSAADGSGVVREPRLYQLIRQTGAVRDRTFEIEFLDAGAYAYVFTFG
jgi:thiol-disulfide isomerase/thioredoxin